MCQYGQDVAMHVERYEEAYSELIPAFDCGEKDFNKLVQEDSKSEKTVTYLFLEEDTDQIIAYVSIACSGIMFDVETDSDNVFLANEATIIPSIEIKYFAVHQDYRHMLFEPDASKDQTLSAYILKYCMQMCTNIAHDVVGAQKIILYAVPKAKRFYERCGFKRFEMCMTRDADPFLQNCVALYYTIPSQ